MTGSGTIFKKIDIVKSILFLARYMIRLDSVEWVFLHGLIFGTRQDYFTILPKYITVYDSTKCIIFLIDFKFIIICYSPHLSKTT